MGYGKGVNSPTRVLAVANQKGGVGKTTSVVNLSASIALLGHRVLVIDLDPQGNASTGLGIDIRTLQHSVYDVLLHETPIEDAVQSSAVKGLFVVPANLDLAGAEIELVPVMGRETRLRKALERVAGDYDYVFIDCPPSLGLLTVNALTAAHEVLVPVQCEYYALEGLAQLLRNIELVNKNLNPSLHVSTILCQMYDSRTKLSADVVKEVRAHFGDKVLQTVIPRTVKIAESPSHGMPVVVLDPSSVGAEAYKSAAKEVANGRA
ncbi:MAG: ParA family protein [Acidimicrobiia bacterium]|nr:ParA family protein [Acidimicrobiia bacterium]